MKREQIIQNLKDAGLSFEQIEEILMLYEKRKISYIYEIMDNYRKGKLESVHKFQKKIDYLDFFLYKLKKEDKNKWVKKCNYCYYNNYSNNRNGNLFYNK